MKETVYLILFGIPVYLKLYKNVYTYNMQRAIFRLELYKGFILKLCRFLSCSIWSSLNHSNNYINIFPSSCIQLIITYLSANSFIVASLFQYSHTYKEFLPKEYILGTSFSLMWHDKLVLLYYFMDFMDDDQQQFIFLLWEFWHEIQMPTIYWKHFCIE